MSFDGWHESIFEPIPDNLPQPMKRMTCSCGWKAVSLWIYDLDDKFAAHLQEVAPLSDLD